MITSVILMVKILLRLIISLVGVCGLAAGGERGLYAFFNAVPKGTVEEQAQVLKELGYAGMSQVYEAELGEKLEKRVRVFEKAGLKVKSVYVLATEKPMVAKQVKALANRGAVIELQVRTLSPEIVDSIRKTAEMAKGLKIKVAVYLHANFAVERTDQAVELVKEVGHENFGVMLNVCHFLHCERGVDLEEGIKRVAKYLFFVSTNGAKVGGKGWGELIQSLDKGDFDQGAFLKLLKKYGYEGDVGLQGYRVKGDRKDNLRRSMGKWKEVMKE